MICAQVGTSPCCLWLCQKVIVCVCMCVCTRVCVCAWVGRCPCNWGGQAGTEGQHLRTD